MWRIGVLALVVLLESTTADVKTGVHHELAMRFKRSTEDFKCEPSGSPSQGTQSLPAQYWSPPPPPPFWRRHHHPPPWAYHQYQPQYQSYSNSNLSNFNRNEKEPSKDQYQSYSNLSHFNRDNDKEPGESQGNNAVSNAESESGQAVAVAIARPSPNH